MATFVSREHLVFNATWFGDFERHGTTPSSNAAERFEGAAIIKLIENGRMQADNVKEFKLTKQTPPGYVKNKAKLLSAFEGSHSKDQKNDRKGEHLELEEALQLRLRGVLQRKFQFRVTHKQKAETFALRMNVENFKFTHGWLCSFKKTHRVSFKKVCGKVKPLILPKSPTTARIS